MRSFSQSSVGNSRISSCRTELDIVIKNLQKTLRAYNEYNMNQQGYYSQQQEYFVTTFQQENSIILNMIIEQLIF
jgi:peptidoglycan hydrolase-like protein with peptidoglycan-binding domain